MADSPRGDATTPDISLFVHVPFCRQKCAYCRLYGVSGREDAFDPFLTGLEREWEIVRREEALEGRGLASLRVSGGTPSLLGAPRLVRLLEFLKRGLRVDGDCEITLEAYPDSIDGPLVESVRRAGYGRINVGVHSFSDRDLAALDRGYRSDEVKRGLAAVREGGCANLGVDLVYGIPGQTAEAWQSSLEAVTACGCEHIACGPLTPQEETLEEHLLRGRFEESELEESLFRQAREAERRLAAAGYEQYEVSLFARPGFRSRYEEHALRREPIYGLGPGANSFDGAVRWRNAPDLDGYLAALVGENRRPERERYRLSRTNQAQEVLLLGLRRASGLRWDEVGQWIEPAVFSRLQRRAMVLGSQGFLELTAEGMRLPPAARFIVHSIALELMRTLGTEAA
jgi:oxygen-independent coproporphyrinogen-3 oxidase